jgi:hypothetical protein
MRPCRYPPMATTTTAVSRNEVEQVHAHYPSAPAGVR